MLLTCFFRCFFFPLFLSLSVQLITRSSLRMSIFWCVFSAYSSVHSISVSIHWRCIGNSHGNMSSSALKMHMLMFPYNRSSINLRFSCHLWSSPGETPFMVTHNITIWNSFRFFALYFSFLSQLCLEYVDLLVFNHLSFPFINSFT